MDKFKGGGTPILVTGTYPPPSYPPSSPPPPPNHQATTREKFPAVTFYKYQMEGQLRIRGVVFDRVSHQIQPAIAAQCNLVDWQSKQIAKNLCWNLVHLLSGKWSTNEPFCKVQIFNHLKPLLKPSLQYFPRYEEIRTRFHLQYGHMTWSHAMPIYRQSRVTLHFYHEFDRKSKYNSVSPFGWNLLTNTTWISSRYFGQASKETFSVNRSYL